MTEQTDRPKGGMTLWDKLKRRKLKNYLFLDKKLQFNFAFLLAAIGLINAFYFGALVYFHTKELFFRLAPYIPEWALSDEMFSQETRLFNMTILFVCIGELVFITLLGLFFSHRIAGPLYAMSIKLKEISTGSVPRPVQLRKDDLLTNFADHLNAAIETLKTQRTSIEAALADANAGNMGACKEKLERLMAKAEEPETSSPSDALPSH